MVSWRKNTFLGLVFCLLLLLSFGIAVEETGDTTGASDDDTAADEGLKEFILVTTINYPDAIIGSRVGDKLGIPLLLTEKEELPADVKAFIGDEQPDQVYMFGGPGVMSTDIEDYLVNESIVVERIWGMTRYGTAAEVIKRFWPEGAPGVVIAADVIDAEKGSGYEHMILDSAKALAEQNDMPILLTAPDALSTETADALSVLETTEVILVGEGINENVTEELKNMGITVTLMGNDDPEEVLKEVKEEIIEEKKKSGETFDKIVIIASKEHDFQSSIGILNSFEDAAREFVNDVADIPKVVEFIKENDIKKVTIVGTPELVAAIAAQVLLIEDIEVDAISTQNLAKKLVERVKKMKDELEKRHKEKREEYEKELEKDVDKLKEKIDLAMEFLDGLFDEVSQQISEMETISESDHQDEIVEKAWTLYDHAKEEYSAILEDYEGESPSLGKLFGRLSKVKNALRKAQFLGKEFYKDDEEKSWDFVKDLTDREQESFEDKIEQLKEEVEMFFEFAEEYGEQGLLAEECDDLIKKVQPLLDKAKEAYDNGEFEKILPLAPKIKAGLKKCHVLTLRQLRTNKGKAEEFMNAFEYQRNEKDFAENVFKCEHRCSRKVDACYRESDYMRSDDYDCFDSCEADYKPCKEKAEALEKECKSLMDDTDNFMDTIYKKCTSRCDKYLETDEDGEETQTEEYYYCVEQCKDLEADFLAQKDECIEKMEGAHFACDRELDRCSDKCDDSEGDVGHGPGDCESIMLTCMPECIGYEHFEDPGKALQICELFEKEEGRVDNECRQGVLHISRTIGAKTRCEDDAEAAADDCMDECDEYDCDDVCKRAFETAMFKCMSDEPQIEDDAMIGCVDDCADFKGYRKKECIDTCMDRTFRGAEMGQKCMMECSDKEGLDAQRCMMECTEPMRREMDPRHDFDRHFEMEDKLVRECEDQCRIDFAHDDGGQPDEDVYCDDKGCDCNFDGRVDSFERRHHKDGCFEEGGMHEEPECTDEGCDCNFDGRVDSFERRNHKYDCGGIGPMGPPTGPHGGPDHFAVDHKCMDRCMADGRDKFFDDYEGPGHNEMTCVRDMPDCEGLRCPHIPGQDTPICMDGMCICGADWEAGRAGPEPHYGPGPMGDDKCEKMCGFLRGHEQARCFDFCYMDMKHGEKDCSFDGERCKSPEECCSGNCEHGWCEPPRDHMYMCREDGDWCRDDRECCSDFCDRGKCEPRHGLKGDMCSEVGDSCEVGWDCCPGLDCVGGACEKPEKMCKHDGMRCRDDEECCGNFCDRGYCREEQMCRAKYEPCRFGDECCSGFCDRGECAPEGGFGPGPGSDCAHPCRDDYECCPGDFCDRGFCVPDMGSGPDECDKCHMECGRDNRCHDKCEREFCSGGFGKDPCDQCHRGCGHRDDYCHRECDEGICGGGGGPDVDTCEECYEFCRGDRYCERKCDEGICGGSHVDPGSPCEHLCDKDSDCCDDWFCDDRGKCQPEKMGGPTPSDCERLCRDDYECCRGDICDRGKCVPDHGGPGYDDCERSCRNGGDCCSGWFCDDRGKCQPEHDGGPGDDCERPCRDDYECCRGDVCDRGKCVPGDINYGDPCKECHEQCHDDKDCHDDCDRDKCDWDGPDDRCTPDGDYCKYPQECCSDVCDRGKCVPDHGGPGDDDCDRGCRDDYECCPGDICNNGWCKPEYDGGPGDCTPASFCLTDGDCCGGTCDTASHKCMGGSGPGPSPGMNDCPSDKPIKCDDGRCEPSYAACNMGGTACPEDAKVCPDGTTLVREGPNCEFPPCPGDNTGCKGEYDYCMSGGDCCPGLFCDYNKNECIKDDMGDDCPSNMPIRCPDGRCEYTEADCGPIDCPAGDDCCECHKACDFDDDDCHNACEQNECDGHTDDCPSGEFKCDDGRCVFYASDCYGSPTDFPWGCNNNAVCEPEIGEDSENCNDCTSPVSCNNNGICDPPAEDEYNCPSDCYSSPEPTDEPGTTCAEDYSLCNGNDECCSNDCKDGTCRPDGFVERSDGDSCTFNWECQSYDCSNGICGGSSGSGDECYPDGESCSDGPQCCSGFCDFDNGGVCAQGMDGDDYMMPENCDGDPCCECHKACEDDMACHNSCDQMTECQMH